MWVVRLALDRIYTFIVLAVLILLLGIVSVVSTPTDIFPKIDIPVVSVIWTYDGLPASEMATRVTTFSEFVMALVNDVKSIESQTLNGVSVIKIYFHPQVHIDAAMAQVTSAVQGIRFRMPPAINPPWILRFGADTVPIIQLALSSDSLSEAALYDYGLFRVRQQLSTVPGTLLPAPYGGKVRQIMVDLDPNSLTSKGLTPIDISNALNSQNVTLPTGTVKVGLRDYPITTNSSPRDLDELNRAPIKIVNGTLVHIRDVAHVHDGFAVQQNAVRRDGHAAVLLSIMKTGSVSTLDIVDQIKNDILPTTRAAAPPGMKITELFDQSLFVRASIQGVIREGLIAACLTAAMILLFLGSWRSTLIIAVSIPLSILSSIIALSALGHTLNVMTLGGLALAIGILVDDATVTIENIHRHMGGESFREAVLQGASEIAAPTFVSTLTICIVFVSVVFLTGPARYLFTPMAMAVVFAMLASYILSRTLVPVLVKLLLENEHHEAAASAVYGRRQQSKSFFGRIHDRFNQGYDFARSRYAAWLAGFLAGPKRAFFVSGVVMLTPFLLLPFIGRDFFPAVDAGQLRLHVRASPGLRLEQTKSIFTGVEQQIRDIIPAGELELILDNVGRSPDSFNLAFGDGATIGPFDGEILVSLKKGNHAPTDEYVKRLRKKLPQLFPELTFYFQPADIVSQILDFGLPAPIDIQVAGYGGRANYDIAQQIQRRISRIPGAVDVHLQQVLDAPSLHIDINRDRSAEFGLSLLDVANSLNVSLSSSAQVQPNWWLDPKMGMTYMVAAQTPQYRVNSINAVENTPIPTKTGSSELLSNMASISRGIQPVNVNHRNVQPVFDVFANIQNSDLGSVASQIQKVVKELQPKLAPGNTLETRGEVSSMQEAFQRLGVGLVFAAVLVYLLMVVNFQSWLEPFIIITALPGAFCGIVWALFITQTTFNVPSLMGAIMSIGVATANSILLVTFANERFEAGQSAFDAAIEAGTTRLRPILMTAFAMIIGMVPMALGLGEGGEQNAPLARAVIGGLTCATVATLFFVPLMFSVLRNRSARNQELA